MAHNSHGLSWNIFQYYSMEKTWFRMMTKGTFKCMPWFIGSFDPSWTSRKLSIAPVKNLPACWINVFSLKKIYLILYNFMGLLNPQTFFLLNEKIYWSLSASGTRFSFSLSNHQLHLRIFLRELSKFFSISHRYVGQCVT